MLAGVPLKQWDVQKFLMVIHVSRGFQQVSYFLLAE